MFNPDTAPVSVYMPPLETAARSFKVAPIIAPVHSDVEIDRFETDWLPGLGGFELANVILNNSL
jgi:hypothetical protein